MGVAAAPKVKLQCLCDDRMQEPAALNARGIWYLTLQTHFARSSCPVAPLNLSTSTGGACSAVIRNSLSEE
jgi:hypothetical protein